jgi:hypothetical protein
MPQTLQEAVNTFREPVYSLFFAKALFDAGEADGSRRFLYNPSYDNWGIPAMAVGRIELEIAK